MSHRSGRKKLNKANDSSKRPHQLRPKTVPAQEEINQTVQLQHPVRGPLGPTASLRQAQVLQMQRLQGNSFVGRYLQRPATSNQLPAPDPRGERSSPKLETPTESAQSVSSQTATRQRLPAASPPGERSSPKLETPTESAQSVSSPTLAAVHSMGKLVIGYTDTLPGLQREGEGEAQDDQQANAGTSAGPVTLSSSRFAAIKALVDIAQGTGELTKKNNGAAVQAVQQAVFDMGYPLPRFRIDGKIGSETREAIRRFREDSTLPPSTALDGPAMQALDRKAPAVGKTARKSVDYDKLLADGKLTFTIAVGFDEHGVHKEKIKELRNFFKAKGLTGEVGSDGLGLFSKQITFLVSDPDTGGFKGKIVKVQVRFITPDTKDAKAQFTKGLSQDDIAVYSGHARVGTGPDFDHKKSAAENFTIGVGSALHKTGKIKRPPGMNPSWYAYHRGMKKVLDKRKNDLEKMEAEGKLDPKKYQVWFFDACSTIHYLDELRNPALTSSKTRKNLDIIGTRNSIYGGAGVEAAKAFITSIMNSETLDQMMGNMQGGVDRWVDEATADGAKLKSQAKLFYREGFGDNPSD